MRFFTQQWCNGSLSDEEVEATWTAYRAHLDALLPRMAATVRALAFGVNVHDGLLQRVVLDRMRRTLTILMRCGDLQVGYFDLEIIYHEVRLTPEDVTSLRDLAGTPGLEALYDELDVFGVEGWVHRMLFSDYRETKAAFQRMGLRLTPTPGRAPGSPVRRNRSRSCLTSRCSRQAARSGCSNPWNSAGPELVIRPLAAERHDVRRTAASPPISNMQDAYFEGRQHKAYGDFVRAAELVVGRVYFKVSFLDQDMVIPDLSSWVFIGRDLNPRLPGLYFQDADSYLGGARRGDQDWVPTFEGQALPDGCGWGEDVHFEWERERQYSGVYEFEGALDSLLACSLRRERWDGNVRVADAPTESE